MLNFLFSYIFGCQNKWFCLLLSLILRYLCCTLTENSLQVLYNPRRLNGYGLLDGELVERLWSYMRPFVKITKEMTLSHRQDLLADALAHFSKGKSHNIGKYFCNYAKNHSLVDSFLRTLAVYCIFSFSWRL